MTYQEELDKLKPLLGGADEDRVSYLDSMMVGGPVNLAAAGRALFPGLRGKKLTSALSSLRHRVNKAAERAGLSLRLAVDTRLRSPPNQRRCWWEGGGGDEPVAWLPERWWPALLSYSGRMGAVAAAREADEAVRQFVLRDGAIGRPSNESLSDIGQTVAGKGNDCADE